MSKRLEILNGSLVKKRAKLEAAFETHFSDVKRGNGQPMNDKKCGPATFKRWDKQSDAIRNCLAEIEKTENAIDREGANIRGVNAALSGMPEPILALIESGVLIQWRKHPNTFFVGGVDKARIQYKNGKLLNRYAASITDKGQYAIFRDVFNGLRASLS